MSSSEHSQPSRCDVTQLFDDWVGCLVNSDCFRVSEGSMGPKNALKHCAALAKAQTGGCGRFYEEWNHCKLSGFKSMLETPPTSFADNPLTRSLGIDGSDGGAKKGAAS